MRSGSGNKGNIVANDNLSNLQQKNSKEIALKVAFSEPVAIEIIQGIPMITKFDAIGTKSYRIYTSNPDQVRKNLLNIAVTYQLQIVSLETEKNSLEQIFRSLTTVN